MLKRLSLIGLFALSVILCTNEVVAENIAHGVSVVVIDAGHGGKFPGACYGGVTEKSLTLKVALRLGRMIETDMPGVKVVYTRKSDTTLGATLADDLQARADIANKAGGDLFISIHVNAAPRATGVRGVETLIMGESSKEQRYNESALYENNREDLIDMSDERTAAIVRAYIQNLQFTYGEYSMALARCMQNSYLKAGRYSRGVKPQLLRVLYATDMPGVLTEIGFMTNAQELAYMKSEKGQNEIAQSLFRAVKNYSTYLAGMRGEEEPTAQPTPQPAEDTTTKPAVQPTPTPATQPESRPAEKPFAPAAERPTPKPIEKSQTTPAATPKPAPTPTAAATSKPTATQGEHYAIQVVASTKAEPVSSAQFKSYRNRVKLYRTDGRFGYKYCVGEYADRSEAQRALPAVKKVFPEAFVVKCNDGRVVK